MAVQESKLVITIDSRHALRDAQAMRRELESLDKTGQFASKSMDQMSVAMRQLAGYTAGLITVSAAINKMDAYTGMQNRLKLVTESQEQLNQAMGDTFGIAQKSYQSWDSVIQVYQRFSDNAKTLKIDMAKTAELTETVSKAVAISGASTQAAEAALTQFGQALASGTLRGEELNSILEQTPALAKAIAQGMGITVGQLRSVAAEGKITGEVLVDALTKSKGSVDELFAKTDVTIGQSLTLLNNEITKFVGGAGQASGAASLMAGSIKILGENLGTVANIAVLGGIAALTKAIAFKTIAMQGSISIAMAQSAADLKQKQDALTLATAKVNEAKAHLANVQATNAETQAKYGATAANARYKLASDAVTRSVAAQTAAQSALNTSASIGSKALGLIGGPIGAITLGVTALAAGYMYLQNRTAEANAKLEDQGKVAEKTKEELLALKGIQLDVAKDDLAASFEAQNEALRKADIAFNGFIRTIANGNKQSAEAKEIYDQVRQGLVSQEEAIERLNKLNLLTPEQKAQGLDLINSYEEARDKAQKNADAQKILGKEVVLAGNASQNSAGQHRTQANALNGVEGAARGAANALSEFAQQAQQSGAIAKATNTIISKGYSPKVAADLAELAVKNGKVTREEAAALIFKHREQEKLNKTLEKHNSIAKESAKRGKDAAAQAKKDANEAKRLEKEQENSRKYLDYEYLDDFSKFRADYLREVEEIQKANFGAKEAEMLKKAEERYIFEEEMYLRQITEEINTYKWSEEEKLKYFYETQRIIVGESGRFNDEIKELKLKSLKEGEERELGLLKLAKETRIFQAEQAMMTEIQRVQKRYQLEREEIIKTANLDVEERTRRLNALNENTIRGGVGKNFSDPDDQSSQFLQSVQYSPVAKTNVQRLDEENAMVLQKLKDNLSAVKEAENASHEERLEAERVFRDAKQQLEDEYYFKAQDARRMDYENQLSMYNSMISMTGGVFGELMGIVSQYKDENTKTYKTMFAFQKAAALAQAVVSTELAATQVMSDPTALTMAQKMLYAGVIRATGYASAGIIAAQAFMGPGGEGYANGGYTGHGGKYDPAGIVHKGEGVLTQEEIKALGGPQGFEDLRKSIRRGYATGGLVADTHRVGMGAMNAINNGGNIQAEKQAQANVKAGGAGQQSQASQLTIINQIEQDDIVGNYMRGAAGGQIVLNLIKANPSEFKRALGV